MHVRVLLKELPHLGSFVRLEVVNNDMDFLLRLATGYHLIEEADELLTRVPRRGFTQHLTGAYIERCI